MVNIAKLVSTVKKGLSSKEAKEFIEMMKKKMPQGKLILPMCPRTARAQKINLTSK